MEAAVRKGRKLPDWYLEEPPRQPLDQFYLGSFWALSTTRNYEFGPIPWDQIVKYGLRVGLDDDMIEVFVILLRAMDAGYLEYMVSELDRQRKPPRPKKK